MKRLSLILSLLLLVFVASAQTYNVRMKSGAVVKFNSSDIEYVDFSANGEAPIAVDLDLPSGRLWANMNVGASSPEGYGFLCAACALETLDFSRDSRFSRGSRFSRDSRFPRAFIS